MIKLAKYLRPFALGLFFAIAFLFVQAFCDLSLPNYMSDIVNVGIQQGGVENASPEAVSAEGMALMLAFMTNEDKSLTERSYELVKTDSGIASASGRATTRARDAASIAQAYPLAADELYILNDTGVAGRKMLDAAFGSAAWALISAMRELAEQRGETLELSSVDRDSIELSEIYRIIPMLGGLPPDVIENARNAGASNDAGINIQSGVMLTGAFYRELGVDMAALQNGYIVRTGLFMLGISLFSGLAAVLVSLLGSRISAGFAKNLRSVLFSKAEGFGSREFEKFSAASLITRCTNDVMQVQTLIQIGIRMFCFAPIMGIGGVVMALRKSVSMGWIIALACVLLLGIITVVTIAALPKFKMIQKLIDKLNLVARESLTGLMVIRAFGNQAHEEERFRSANEDLTQVNLFVIRVMVTMMPLMMFIMNGVTLLIVWVGAHHIANASMQIGDMMAFIQYAMHVIMSFLIISMVFIMAPRAAVSGARIAEVLATETEIQDPENPESMDPSKQGIVEFRGVSFKYDDAEDYALRDISFTAKPGKTTAFIGSTGSGKTTAVKLLLRFYDVTEGQVLVGGADIRRLRMSELRRSIGYVPQKSMLLRDTISSNLRYGNGGADETELEKASEIAQAMDFISEKEDGFEAMLSQSGSNLSGGQKQRLSIARALVKKPDIFVFDDSFSALDFKTDSALRRELRKHTGDSTMIIVAQRISTIMNADEIIVLDNGGIVGRGTHDELLRSCLEYNEIASSQLRKEESE